MLRLRWLDLEPDDRSTPVDWRFPALIIATLFLNFPFWFAIGPDLWAPVPLPLNAVIWGAEATLITALFFLGPTLATQASSRSLLGVAENSLGSIPAFGLRLCCVCYLVRWLADLVVMPVFRWMSIIFRQEVSSTEYALVAATILAFIAITGLQSLRTLARLALFTNKLGIAILVAALLRVRDGWPAALHDFPNSAGRSAILDAWHGLAGFSFYLAPLAFLAAGLGNRIRGQKQVMMIALFGLVLPLAVTMALVGAIGVATSGSQFYQPSLEPNVAMALWGHAATSALPGRMMIAMITIFGAARFGGRALADSVSELVPGKRLRMALLGCFIIGIAWLAVHTTAMFSVQRDWSATCLAVAAAVLTADFMTRKWRAERVRRLDWIGVIALLAGLATPLYMPYWMVGAFGDQGWHPWLLPSYGVGFLVCLLGRALRFATGANGPSRRTHHSNL